MLAEYQYWARSGHQDFPREHLERFQRNVEARQCNPGRTTRFAVPLAFGPRRREKGAQTRGQGQGSRGRSRSQVGECKKRALRQQSP